MLRKGNRISKHYFKGKIECSSLVFAIGVMIKACLKKTEEIFIFQTVHDNHLYLFLKEFTQILVLPIGNKYWQLRCSGINAWLKNGWQPITGGLKIVCQKKKKNRLQFIKLESRNKQILACCSQTTQGDCLGATF